MVGCKEKEMSSLGKHWKCSEETKRKIGEANKGKHHSEETKRRIGITVGINNGMLGKHHTEKTKRKISEMLKGKPSTPGFSGRKHTEETKRKLKEAGRKRICSEETKQKLSKANKGRKPTYGMLGKHHTEKSKEKMKENRINLKGKDSPSWKGGKSEVTCKVCGNKFYVTPAKIKNGRTKFCSRKCLGIWNIQHMKQKDTSIEIAIEKELIRRHILYLKQTPIEGIALVDFLLSDKKIIQCDGNYFHSREKNKGKDIAQDTVLYFKGYKVFRFTETEIKKSPKKCIDKVLKEAR